MDSYVDTTVIGLKEKALTGGGLGSYELAAKKSAEVIVVTGNEPTVRNKKVGRSHIVAKDRTLRCSKCSMDSSKKIAMQ